MKTFVSQPFLIRILTRLSTSGSMHLFKKTIISFRVMRAILTKEDLKESAILMTEVVTLCNWAPYWMRRLEWCLQILLTMLQASNWTFHSWLLIMRLKHFLNSLVGFSMGSRSSVVKYFYIYSSSLTALYPVFLRGVNLFFVFKGEYLLSSFPAYCVYEP